MEGLKVDGSGFVAGLPEIKEFGQGQRLASFPLKNVATKKNGGETTTWLRVTVFGDLVNQVASLTEGEEVYIKGTLGVRPYEGKDGTQKLSVEASAFFVGRPLAAKSPASTTAKPAPTRSQMPFDDATIPF